MINYVVICENDTVESTIEFGLQNYLTGRDDYIVFEYDLPVGIRMTIMGTITNNESNLKTIVVKEGEDTGFIDLKHSKFSIVKVKVERNENYTDGKASIYAKPYRILYQ